MVSDIHNIRKIGIRMLHCLFFTSIDRFNVPFFRHTVLGLVTFVLTFFLSQAYALWKTIYGKGRELQGNLNDIS